MQEFHLLLSPRLLISLPLCKVCRGRTWCLFPLTDEYFATWVTVMSRTRLCQPGQRRLNVRSHVTLTAQCEEDLEEERLRELRPNLRPSQRHLMLCQQCQAVPYVAQVNQCGHRLCWTCLLTTGVRACPWCGQRQNQLP
ncbi:uncharacterized protein LOC143282919 [Babylonia areolata]|uniref:uncharacterized protein LOC143282919 n=1 Tax=Babylonia areolata TaxID=304850 RepID=UPI003FD2A483